MNVYLIEIKQYQTSVWLPNDVEGRYRFPRNTPLAIVPIVIEAENEKWIVSVSKDATFVTGDNRILPTRKVPLEGNNGLIIQYNNKKYFVIYEPDSDENNVFIPYYVENYAKITLGRTQENDLFCPLPYISRNHASISHENGRWFIQDLNSSNGVYVNGRGVTTCELKLGDTVSIIGLKIIIGHEFIAINNKNNRFIITSPKIREVEGRQDSIYSKATGEAACNNIYARTPRKIENINAPEIEIEMPPVSLTGNKMPLLLRMGSPILNGGRSIMSGNYLGAVSSMVLPSIMQGMSEKERKDYEKLRDQKYREYLNYKRQEISNEIIRETSFLNMQYPDLATTMSFVEGSTRLWERRTLDEDFLKVSVGHGTMPMIAEKNYQKRKFEMEPDELETEMYKLCEAPTILNNVPIQFSLKDKFIVSMFGDSKASYYCIRNMILNLIFTHAYDELKIVILANEIQLKFFEFLKFVPHFWSNDLSIRFMGSSQADIQQINKFLNKKYDDYKDKFGKKDSQPIPAYVIFALDADVYESCGVMKEIVSNHTYSGFSIVTSFSSGLKESREMIVSGENYKLVDLDNSDVDDITFITDRVNDLAIINSIKKLNSIKLKLEGASHQLPNSLTFLEMFGVGKVEHLNPFKRWKENNPVKSLAAEVGVGTDGGTFVLDLHEKRQGPHGLVAGTTGSGKSEFLITYILSMAVNYSPDEVAFILIDYKGGGLADAFVDEKRGIHLPHIVGTITNLDVAGINRSLVSINSELKRRQAFFKKAKTETDEGTMDIYDYQKYYRMGKVKEPMPHLFIISDEFAELKKQQPQFMDELISTARIGRSLGVHLILATQKPSGVVNDQIWSNTKFRVCLRVADKGDSNEMLKRPEAAEIKNTGRFYLQVGYNELFELGQASWCGAEYVPQDEVSVETDKSVQFIDTSGQVIYNAKPAKKAVGSGQKQIVAIVKYLSELSKREGISPRSLWCDPLPSKMDYDELVGRVGAPAKLSALIGMFDDPEKQTQFPFVLNTMSFHHMIICGPNGGGKSSFIKTMLFSLVQNNTPEEFGYMILDMSGGTLLPFASLPHCGGYITENEEGDFDRILKYIKEEVTRRKELFLKEGVSNYSAYVETNTLTRIFFIIDNYTNINNFKKGIELNSALNGYMKEASAYGISFIYTCNQMNELHSRINQEADCYIGMQAKDRYEYQMILDKKIRFDTAHTSGRGIAVVDERPLEFQVAITDALQQEKVRTSLLKGRISAIAEKYIGCRRFEAIKFSSKTETYAEFCNDISNGRIPIGYSVSTMKKTSVPFKQLGCTSIWFGNPEGVDPVLSNLIYAANKNDMDLIIVRRTGNTIFMQSNENEIFKSFNGHIAYYDATLDGVQQLSKRLINEIGIRNIYRDEFCSSHAVEQSASVSRAKIAADYIREKTKPVMVIFECFADICTLPKGNELTDMEKTFEVVFNNMRYYNFYFFGCFYPEDPNIIEISPFFKSFVKEQFCLLFGGRYNRQKLIIEASPEMRRSDKIIPFYDAFIMKYRNEFYAMRMPCGEIKKKQSADPDEDSIV